MSARVSRPVMAFALLSLLAALMVGSTLCRPRSEGPTAGAPGSPAPPVSEPRADSREHAAYPPPSRSAARRPQDAAATSPAPGTSEGAASALAEIETGIEVRVSRAGHPIDGCTFGAVGPDGVPTGPVSMAVSSRHPGAVMLQFPPAVRPPFELVVTTRGGLSSRATVQSLEDRIDVEIPAGGRVLGIVTTSAGQALPSLRVVIAGQSVESDARGRFAVDGVPLGSYSGAEVLFGGVWRRVQATFAVPRDGDSVEVVLPVPPAPEFRVRVLDAADGQPVADADVRVRSFDAGVPVDARLATNELGEAVFNGLRDGTYNVAALLPPGPAARAALVRLPEESEIELRIARGTGDSVSGFVRDDSGRAVVGAVVTVDGPVRHAGMPVAPELRVHSSGAGRTDEQGRFSVSVPFSCDVLDETLLGGAACDLWIRVDGMRRKLAAAFVVGAGRDRNLVVGETAELTGVILDADGGTPPRDLGIQFRSDEGLCVASDVAAGRLGQREWFSVVPGRPGVRFRLVGPVGGLHGTLAIWSTNAESIPWMATLRVDPARQGATDVGTVHLTGPGGVRVVDGDRRRRPLVVARTTRPDRYVRLPTYCGDRNTPAFGATLTPDPIEMGRLAMDAGAADLRADAITEVRARLPIPASLRVQVVRGRRVVEGASVALVYPEEAAEFLSVRDLVWVTESGQAIRAEWASALDAASNRVGCVEFQRLPPGAAYVVVRCDGSEQPVRRSVQIAEGHEAEMTVDVDSK